MTTFESSGLLLEPTSHGDSKTNILSVPACFGKPKGDESFVHHQN